MRGTFAGHVGLVLFGKGDPKGSRCFQAEVFLAIDPESFHEAPQFLISANLSDNQFDFVETELVPPASMREDTGFYMGSWFRKVGQMPLVKGAIRNGCWLSAPQLKQVCGNFKVKLPQKGSGKARKDGTKPLIKVDFARAAIKHFCSDMSEEQQKHALQCLLRGAKTPVDLEVLQLIESLDTDNAQAFKELKQDAMQEFEHMLKRKATERKPPDNEQEEQELKDVEAEAKKKAQEAAFQKRLEDDKARKEKDKAAESERLWNLTPHWLRDLLPGQRESGVSAQYHPIKNYFQVRYPSASSVFPVFGFCWCS